MREFTTDSFPVTIGLDLGNTSTQCAVYGADRKRIEERKVTTNRERIQALLQRFPGARVVMEASTASRWISNLAEELGHEVVIANPRCIPIITKNVRKCDRNDARLLAELGQLRPSLLSPVTLREDCFQEVRTLLFARLQLVKQRTALVCFIRSEVRVLGHSLPSCGTKVFSKTCRALIPESLQAALNPLFDSIQNMTDGIDQFDKSIEAISANDFPQAEVLRQVHGVGPLIALAFVATIGDPSRFLRSRTIGAYLGLVPRIRQSGKSDPALSITKCGDRYMRSLLVSAATRILGPHGEDSGLRRFGERIASQGGKRAKARARIAVARKLGVLLHALLRTGEVYEPLRNCELPEVQAA